jgi:hypothetical protein
MCNAEGHIFIYSCCSTGGEVPEGLFCVCGMMVSHYKTCKECGTKVLKPILNKLHMSYSYISSETVLTAPANSDISD